MKKPSESKATIKIGEVAKASGISAKMIRYYERSGLIQPAARNQAGYRLYQQRDIHTLRFIRRARDLGFSIEDIHDLLGLWHDQQRASGEVKRLALAHVDRLRTKIRVLEQMAQTLESLAASCHGDDRSDCPILAEIEMSEESDQVKTPRRGALTSSEFQWRHDV